jgi:hypothetical protein
MSGTVSVSPLSDGTPGSGGTIGFQTTSLHPPTGIVLRQIAGLTGCDRTGYGRSG